VFLTLTIANLLSTFLENLFGDHVNVRQKIKESSILLAGDTIVADVRIGLRYTAVLLDNDRLGVAYTFHRDSIGRRIAFKGFRPLAGRRASELLAMFDSTDKIESAIALATSNALSNTLKEDYLKGDTLEYLDLHPDDRVGMVGYFAPLIPNLRDKISSLMVFEQKEMLTDGVLPEEEVYKQLPHCQAAFITATSILNHTIDAILDAAQSCREVVLLGSSTPLIPEVFKDTPVSVLSGVVVTRPEDMLRIVSEGGGMRFFRHNIQKVNIRLRQTFRHFS
jgi:uncharacterized protein (DUF4213/DUF364 family)